MFGIKMKPDRILQMAKAFGINIETLIPQIESTILKEWEKLEREANSEIMAVAALDDTKSHFVISVYKHNSGGNLELWRNFPLKDISKILKNLENDPEQIEVRSIANGQLCSSGSPRIEQSSGHEYRSEPAPGSTE